MKAILRSGFLALAIIALAVPADAGPFEDGLAAYRRDDYATALKFWRPLAEQGDALAQNNLGVIYEFGLSVPQDIVQAHMWFWLAAAQGNKKAQKARDMVAEDMTPDQIAEAQRMASEWMAKHQQ
jgi:TPR repeat protein